MYDPFGASQVILFDDHLLWLWLWQQKVKELESLENDSKAEAGRLLAMAREETGARKPEDKPDLLHSFSFFPDQLDTIDEKLHDLRAQAEMCAGTDKHVSSQGQGFFVNPAKVFVVYDSRDCYTVEYAVSTHGRLLNHSPPKSSGVGACSSKLPSEKNN